MGRAFSPEPHSPWYLGRCPRLLSGGALRLSDARDVVAKRNVAAHCPSRFAQERYGSGDMRQMATGRPPTATETRPNPIGDRAT